MMILDAHNHFWNFDPVRDAWITEDMSVIRKDFLPSDFRAVLDENGVQGSVAVQADQSLEETDFLLSLAEQHDWIRGVVGWIDLQSEKVGEQILQYQDRTKLKGFRHIAQAEADDFLIQPQFMRGIEALSRTRFTYDILVFPRQLPAAISLVQKFPEQMFVLDHLAKPFIKDGKIKEWKQDIQALAKSENVYCKISGMVTEADWKSWKATDFRTYLDVVTDSFGTGRLLFGSDYPVCLLAADYDQVLDIVQDYISSFSAEEQVQILAKNALEFYNL